MPSTVLSALSSDQVLASLASENIGWAAEGWPAVSFAQIDGAPAFVVDGLEPSFMRISCVGNSFPEAMAMHRRVQSAMADIPHTYLIGGASSQAGRIHTVSSDFEIWTEADED